MNVHDINNTHFPAFAQWILGGGWSPGRASQYLRYNSTSHCPVAVWLQVECDLPDLWVGMILIDPGESGRTKFGWGSHKVPLPPLFYKYRSDLDLQMIVPNGFQGDHYGDDRVKLATVAATRLAEKMLQRLPR